MASAVELATAYITVAASGDDLAPSLGRSFRQVEKVAGDSGKRMGKALTGQVAKATKVDVEQAEAAYEQASKQVTSTAERQATKVESARRKEEIAQAKVTEALQKFDAESSQVLAAQDRLALASQKVEAAQREQESATERANKKLAETKAALDDAKQAADDAEQPFMTLGDRIQTALKGDFKGAFQGVGRESQQAADDVVEDFDEAGDNAGGGMLDGLKGALLTGGAALGIGASFGELFQQGIESVSSTAKLKASLGLSDADAQSLGKDAAGAYANGFGDDLATATDATAAVRQYLGADVDTQWATEMSLAMAEAFGNDPQDNIKAVSQMIRTGMVKDAQEGFDVLTRGFQTGANKADDLTDTMGEYGTLFRNLGIDGSTSIGLMSQGLNAGARDADKVADAFKEFSIRAVDGSETTKDAFSALGLDADNMAQRIGAGGKSARDATQEVLEKLGGIEDPALRAQIAVGLFGTQSEDLGDALYALDLDTAASGMGEIAGSSEKMSDALAEAQSPFDRIKRSFSDIGTTLGGGMLPALDVFADTIIGVGEFFRANPLVFGILATGLTAAAGAAYFASGAAKALFLSIATGIKSIPVIGWVIAGITLLVAALTWFFTKTETGQKIWAKVWGGIKNVFQGVMNWFTGTVMPLFQTIWGVLFEGDFKGGSALQEDSPIVGALFTIRDAALAVGLWVKDTLVPWLVDAWQVISAAAIWLWQNAIVPAWNGISAAIGATVDWLVNTAWPVMKDVWDAIAGAAIWLWQSVIVPAWTGISGAIGAVVDWLVNVGWPLMKGVWDAISAAALWLWRGVIQPVWTGIKTAIAIAVTAIAVYIDLLKWYWESVLAPVAMWLWQNVLQPVWAGIQAAIGAVVVWFQTVAWPALKAAWDAVAAAALWLWHNVLQPVWAGIQTAIGVVVVWFQTVAWPIIQTVIGWIGQYFQALGVALSWVWTGIKTAISVVVAWLRDVAWAGIILPTIEAIKRGFNTMRDVLSAAWSFVRDSVISPVVTWLRDVAWAGVISPTIDRIKSAFNVMRDSLSGAWSFVRDSVIQPVATWFRDTIGGLFDRATQGISDAFGVMKDAVRTAWNGIRDTAKVPVEFVVNKIINDAIIGNYNDVANGVFGLDKVDPVKLPSGWAGGGILPGFTPMHRGDDVLTPMRSGEGVLVSEGLRDHESQRAFLGANEAAKRGISFADFLGRGYAGGGLVKLGMPFAGSYPRGDGFGARGGRHKGIDWPMPSGAVLKAVGAGTVSHSWNPSAGKKLELSIGNGLVAGYHHLSSYIAGRGDTVGAGAAVARVGSTGRSSGPHLHFSLRKDGTYVDPAPYLGAGGAAGTGDSGWWNPFAGLWDSLKSRVREGVGDAPWGDALFEMPRKITDGALDWATDKLTGVFDVGSDSGGSSGGAERWRGQASTALSMKGQMTPTNLSSMLRRMNQESSGDPNAYNGWDSNAAAGNASRGLMQVIPSTFRAYAEPGYGANIFDPLSNMLASINYTLSRYGSLTKGWDRAGGYALGGIVDGAVYDTGGVLESGAVALNLSGRPEVVLNPAESRAYMAGQASAGAPAQGGDTWNIYGADAEDAAEKTFRKLRRLEALRAK